MEQVKKLATLTLTHKPFKMIDRLSKEEKDVWGDDWDDSPASYNSGAPYGGESVDIEAGDLVIVIKRTVVPKQSDEK
jgi:hypothetical protein